MAKRDAATENEDLQIENENKLQYGVETNQWFVIFFYLEMSY